LSGIHGRGSQLTREQAAQIFVRDVPDGVGPQEFARRLGEWLPELVDVATGQARLPEALSDLRSALPRRYHLRGPREATDRALAQEQSALSASADCMRRQRYTRDCERGRESALKLLMQLQKMRLQHGEALGYLTADVSDGVQSEPEAQVPADAAPEASA